jgi:hypothetical protein
MKHYSFLIIIATLFTSGLFGQSAVSDTIPLTINEQNTIYVKAIFNGSDTFNLNFDTGTTELILTNKVLTGRLQSTTKLYNTFYNLKIGRRTYQTKVYDAELTGHGTDGRFGWDLFKDKVVELNYDKGLMVIHDQTPRQVVNDKAYTKLPVNYFDNVFTIETTIIQNGVESKDSFLFDTGYQRTVMLDNDLLKKARFPVDKMEEIKKVIMKGAQGNEVPVITSNLERLQIGGYTLENVPVQQITGSKPMRGHDIHILGNEVLKRFNTFLDFTNNVIYIKPNKLYSVEYVEKRKSA